MKVDSLMRDAGPSIYYDPDFRNVLEAHMTYLRNTSNEYIAVEPSAAYKYEFDFFSLLAFYKVPSHLHWVVMRMNNYASPTDNGRDLTALMLPNQKLLSQIVSSHKTIRKLA